MIDADPIADFRLRLRAAGFPPVPLNGKRPHMNGWEKLGDATREEITRWSRVRPAESNTGCLTAHVPTLDVDVLDPEAAIAVEETIREQFEERGVVLVRFGLAPKRAIPFPTDTPFPKITANLIAPDGNSGQKLEFLGNGQQFVVDGIHPDTHKPYDWHGGQPGEIQRDDLPYINAEEAQALVEDAVRILGRFGYTRAQERPKEKKGNGADHHGAADWSYLFENIRNGHELHGSLRDLAAKMIASGMSAGATVNFLRAQMEGSAAAKDDRWKERYAGIPRLVEGAEAKFREAGTEHDGDHRQSRRDSPPHPGDDAPKPVEFKTLGAFIREYFPLHYIVEPIISGGSLYTLTGTTGTGKTLVLILMLLAIATGRRSILNLDVIRGRVAFLTAENPTDAPTQNSGADLGRDQEALWLGDCLMGLRRNTTITDQYAIGTAPKKPHNARQRLSGPGREARELPPRARCANRRGCAIVAAPSPIGSAPREGLE
jgi:Bifunctional DNA primase/polymerase, N-terminal/AAA domain